MDKVDVAKMVTKENAKKQVNGSVYSNQKGHIDFHSLDELPMKSQGDKTLTEKFSELTNENVELKKKISTLKEVLLNYDDRLKAIEAILDKYGYQ